MGHLRAVYRLALALLVLSTTPARANPFDGPVTVTFYGGPSSTKYFGAVLQSLKLQPTGAMAGVAVDARLLYLGQGISIAAETQVTQYFWGHENTTAALGLGFQFNNIFGWDRTDWSIYAGPSYASDPPYTSIGYRGRIWPASRVKFLNFVGIEWAVGLGHDSPWQGVFRVYHRSGLYGVYSISDDDGVALGWGIRRSF